MPRPSKGPLHKTAMNLPVDLWKALRLAAAEDDMDVTAIVERAAHEYLDRRMKKREKSRKRR
jgi:hypothetical protein